MGRPRHLAVIKTSATEHRLLARRAGLQAQIDIINARLMGGKRDCPVCHRLFLGRPDQKYCSPSCRNLFHTSKIRQRARTLEAYLSRDALVW